MSDSTLALQEALIAALRGDAAIAALVGTQAFASPIGTVVKVFDPAPQEVTFPYVSLGSEICEPLDTATATGSETAWQIDVWSRKPGAAEAREIMAAIRACLHEADLTVAGHQFVRGSLLSSRSIPEPDGIGTHGVLLFRFITQL